MDLDAIEARASKYAEHTGTLRCCNAHDTAAHVPALVARVRELESKLASVRALHTVCGQVRLQSVVALSDRA